jgi:hypothetical protein
MLAIILVPDCFILPGQGVFSIYGIQLDSTFTTKSGFTGSLVFR